MNRDELLDGMKATLHEFSVAFGTAALDGKVLELPGVTAAIAPGIPFRSIFNCVAYDSAEELAAGLPALTDAYQQSGVTAWAVWVHEADREAAKLLEQAGHQLDSKPAGMAIELNDLADAPTNQGLQLGPADELAAVDLALARSYDFPPGVMVYAFPQLLKAFNVYLARDGNSEPLGVLATVDNDDDCGFTLVGTVPEARGRGVASVLVRHALIDARERGCVTASLQSTAIAKSIYEGLGFTSLGAVNLWERRED